MASQNSDSGGKGGWMGAFVMIILTIMMWPIYRPYAARTAVTIAVLESRGLLHVRPLLKPSYANALDALNAQGTALLARKGIEQFRRMENKDITAVMNVPGRLIAPWFLLSFIFAAWQIWATDLRGRFRRRFTLEQMIKMASKTYPHLLPILKVNPQNEPMDEGPFAVKIGYIEFALKHDLLRDGAGKLIPSKEYEHRAAYFDFEGANKVFVAQLGPRWTDRLEDLAPYQRAVFGILAAMDCYDRPGMKAATQQMNRSWDGRKSKKGWSFSLTTTIGEELAKKYWDDPRVAAVRKQHSYFLTVMSGMAKMKINSGELCMSHYAWLRPTDPVLFYTLHQDGMELPNIESASAFTHYQLETRAALPLDEPCIDAAVMGLALELASEGWLTAELAEDKINFNPASIQRWAPVAKAKKP